MSRGEPQGAERRHQRLCPSALSASKCGCTGADLALGHQKRRAAAVTWDAIRDSLRVMGQVSAQHPAIKEAIGASAWDYAKERLEDERDRIHREDELRIQVSVQTTVHMTDVTSAALENLHLLEERIRLEKEAAQAPAVPLPQPHEALVCVTYREIARAASPPPPPARWHRRLGRWIARTLRRLVGRP